MSRAARLSVAGYPMHVVQRGNNRCRCFGDEIDFRLYLALLADSARRTGCAVHAYVLMTNHVHLLATGKVAQGVSDMMKRIGECYVKAFNKRHARTGTLWEGRFRSSVIATDQYLLACQRYIEMNPVRAGMVRAPADYPWSSFKANAWGDASFVRPHPTYLELGASLDRRLLAYRRLFDKPEANGEVESIRAALKGGFAVGDELSTGKLASLAGRAVTLQRRGPKPASARRDDLDTRPVSLFDN